MGRPRGLDHVIDGWRQGRRDSIPVCCIAHYCVDGIFGWPSSVVRWKQIRRSHGDGPVPCGLIHAGDSPYRPSQRIARILRFHWRVLQPTATGRRRLQLAREGSPDWRSRERKIRANRTGQLAALYWGELPRPQR